MAACFNSHDTDELHDTTSLTRWWVVAFIACITAALSGRSFGEEPADIVRVEEDWILEILNPDAEESSPQLITAMSSTDRLADVHALFEINHRTLPEFRDGGVGIQLWSGDTNLDVRPAPFYSELATPGETITFTMRLEITDGRVEFSVPHANSPTWGNFGGHGYLKTGASTTQTSLSLYSPAVSVKNSRVGFAKHRVKRYGILRTRYYTHNNVLLSTDETDRMVHVLPTGE